MANVIKHKRGSGSDPVASDLVVGEVAIRTDVGKLFTKMDNGSIAEIAGGGSDIAINTLSSSSGTGGGSATFNGSAYRFTLSAPPSVSAQQLLVSINGVIQKPVAGTGQPSEGFSVDGTDIILGDAPATGSDFFILTFKSLGVSEPADNSVTSAKIVDGAIVNADINASAAIDGSKINPDFGSQNLVIADKIIHSGDTNTAIRFAGNDQFSVQTGGSTRFSITDSQIQHSLNTQIAGTLTMVHTNGNFIVNNNAGTNVFTVNSSSGNVTTTGTVDGRDIATDGTKLDGIASGATNVTNTNQLTNGAGFLTSVGTSNISDNAVTFAKLENIPQNRIIGRVASGSGDPTTLTAANVRSMINVEDGATADQTASDIKTLLNSSGLVNAQIDASAAIAGSKISPTFTSDVTISSASPTLNFTENDANPDYRILTAGGDFVIQNDQSGSFATRLKVNPDGHIDVTGNLDVGAGLDVTGNITVTGTVDGVDIATRDTLFGGLTSSSGVLTNGVTATTQSASDNSTKVATTAYADTAVANLVDSAPGTLNTLNELAAALGDDPNFATTVTNSIATKMPLAGGTFSGAITVTGDVDSTTGIFKHTTNFNSQLKFNGSNETQLKHLSNNQVKLSFVGLSNAARGSIDGQSGFIQIKTAADETGIICRDNSSTDLHFNGIKKFETSNTGVTVTGNIFPSANDSHALGGSSARWQELNISDVIDVSDNGKIRMGDNDDLQIFHSGSHSVLHETGTGELHLQSDVGGVRLQRGNGDTGLFYNVGGAVSLFFDGDLRLETTNTGINIPASVPTITLSDTDGNTPFSRITAGGGDLVFEADQGNEEGNTLMLFRVDDSEKMRLDSNGNLALGTSSINNESDHNKLVISGKSTTGAGIIEFQDVSNNTDGAIFADDGNFFIVADRSNATAGSNLIFRVDGSSERMKIDSNGNLFCVGVFNATTGSSANTVSVSSGGKLRRITSSQRYKTDIETLEDKYADAVLEARPVWYKSLCEDDNKDHGHWGFIAEEIEKIDPRLCSYKTIEIVMEDDKTIEKKLDTPIVESVQYERFIPHLINLVKRQDTKIKLLETKVEALEAK